MVVLNVTVNNCTPQTIVIGRRGTYDTMRIAFDLSFLIKNYGSGTAVLAIKRSQDESAYPAIITQEDATLLWTVNETDTAYVGSGECQLMWYVDGGLAKTIIYPMVVMRDILQTAEEPPDAYQTWVDDLIAKGEETLHNAQAAAQSASDAENAKDDAVAAKEAAEEAQEKAETAVTHYPKIENNYWMVWDVDSQSYVSTGIQAEGEDGYSPEVTITTITGGHRVTITDKDHPQGQTFDVMDGQGGGSGTSDYTKLSNKPQINGHTLTGNQTASQLGLATTSDIPTVPVQSVNGKTGAVVLSATDVGAKPDSYTAPVSSVNNKTGAVTLGAGDIGFSSSEEYNDGTVGAELSELNRHLNAKQNAPSTAGTAGQVLALDDNLNPVWANQSGGGGAVDSVNGKTGTVVLTASDVGAKPASYESPVSSVAGKTGAVTLNAGDVSFDDSATYGSGTVGAELSAQKNAISQLDTDKEDALSIVQKTSSDVTITLEEDKFYIFPTMTELTVTCPLTGLYGFRFTSGTTPTVFLMSGITMPDNWNGTEASKTYDMTILNGLALVTSWSV